MRELAEALPGSEGDAIKGLNLLLSEVGVEKALRTYGMREEDVDKAAAIAMENRYYNPREVEEGKVRELLRRAWAGEEARTDL